MSTSRAPLAHPHTRWPVAVVIGIAASLAVGLVVIAFAWPAATAKARDLPVGISVPSSQVSELRSALARMDPDPVDLHTVDSRSDAVRKIRERTLYGAILLGDRPEVLTSSAASTVSNQALRGVATQLQQRISAATIQALQQRLAQLASAAQGGAAGSSGAQGAAGATGQGGAGSSSSGGASGSSSGATTPPTVWVTDVVALSDDDPTGAGLTAAAFPVVLGGMLGGILLSLLVVGVIRRLLALLVYGVAAGALVALVLQTTLHALHGSWLVNAAALGLSILATATLVVGLNALLGRPGIAVGAIITVLIGNPISGATVPYQFIAAPWGIVGQYFVPGSSATLLRSLSYFPDADTAPQWITLGSWAAAGALLAIVGRFRSEAPVELPERELEPEHARHVAA